MQSATKAKPPREANSHQADAALPADPDDHLRTLFGALR